MSRTPKRPPEPKPTARRVAVKHACYSGENLTDPKRADRLLRRFSWELEGP